jgi:RNA polymerase sigma-70 factor, ECF subfamily
MAKNDPDRSPQNPSTTESKREADLSTSLYQELRRLAARKMRSERVSHTLQPTALVHEAYLKLAETSNSAWGDRPRFLATAACVMRHILVDHARSHNAGKRGAGLNQVTFNEDLIAAKDGATDVLALDEALNRLAVFDPKQAAILEMHYFAGMTFEEIADATGSSTRTVKRESSMARAWLRAELSEDV